MQVSLKCQDIAIIQLWYTKSVLLKRLNSSHYCKNSLQGSARWRKYIASIVAQGGYSAVKHMQPHGSYFLSFPIFFFMGVQLLFTLHVFTWCFGRRKCVGVAEAPLRWSSPSRLCKGQYVLLRCLCLQHGKEARLGLETGLDHSGSTGNARKASELAQNHWGKLEMENYQS